MKTIHGTKSRSWNNIHKDYKSIINGTKYVVVMDKNGATVLMPYTTAKKERLV